MKIKTQDMTGPALDWAVAKCEGWGLTKYEKRGPWYVERAIVGFSCSPSTDWAQGGPIIQREGISTAKKHHGYWVACIYDLNDEPTHMMLDHGQLIAAMRCFVASRLGDEVDVPEELL